MSNPYDTAITICYVLLGLLLSYGVVYYIWINRYELYCRAYYRANDLCDRIGKWTDRFYEKNYNWPDYADRKMYVQTCIVKQRRHKR